MIGESHLVLFLARRESRKGSLHDEGCEFLPVHFGKDHVNVGDAAVGNPHLGATQEIVLSARIECGPSLAVQGVGRRRCLAQAVGAHPLGAREFGQILRLLLFRAKKRDGEDPDAGLRPDGGGPSAVTRHPLRDEDGRNFVELQASKFLRNVRAAEAEFRRFLQQLAQHSRFLLFDFVQAGHNFLVDESLRRSRNQAVLVGDVLGGKHLFRRARFNQEAAAFNSLCDGHRCLCHGSPPTFRFVYSLRQAVGAGHCKFSKIPAAPIPPPTHIVTKP